MISEQSKQDKLARFEVIFNATLDGLILLDKKGKIADVNDATAEILKYSKEELIGLDLLDLHTDEYKNKCRDNIDKAFKGERATCDCPFVDSENKIVFADNLLKNIELGGEEFALVSFHDITAQREAEKKLEVEMETLIKVNELLVGREEKMIELRNELRSVKGNKNI